MPPVLVDPDRDEVRQPLAVLVEHPQRRVASPGDVPCRLQLAVEHGLELTLGDDRAGRLDEDAQSVFVKSWCGHAELCPVLLPAATIIPLQSRMRRCLELLKNSSSAQAQTDTRQMHPRQRPVARRTAL